MIAPEGAADITFWHGYTGVEADTMGQALQALAEKNPDFKVTVLAVPFDQLKNKVSTEAATGGGPDVFLGPPDWVGELAAANLIADESPVVIEGDWPVLPPQDASTGGF